MAKNNHHFVPRLYLKAFQSAEKRIHLYNLKKALPVEHASLRDQCRRHKFYGPTDDTENAVSKLEDLIAPVLRQVIETKTLPTANPEAVGALFVFLALQIVRTSVAANLVNVGTDKTLKQAYSDDPRFADVNLEDFTFGFENAVLITLKLLPEMIDSLMDLSPHLIFSPTKAFHTSDNPVFKYNQYCEQIQHEGITGAVQRGLQIFLPLSPNLQIILYDNAVYQLQPGPSRRFSIATESDVDTMNAMQVISADENLYFGDWQSVEGIRRLAVRTKHHRDFMRVVVQEYGQDNDPNRSLLHEYQRIPCLNLNLSFLRVSRSARKIRVENRARLYRKDLPRPSVPEPPDIQGRTVTFSRFIGRR